MSEPEKTRKASAVIALLLISSMILGLAMLVPLAAATATNTHYFVDSGVEPLCDDDWGTSDCWSHTSGGAGGAGVPGPANNVVFDVNSGSNVITALAAVSVHDIAITDWAGQQITFSSDLTFHDLTVFYTSDFDQVQFSHTVAVQTTTFSGSVTVNAGSPAPGQEHFQLGTANPPSDFLRYSGTNAYGTMSYTRPTAQDASGGPTIYCFPGCSDGGSNVNIVFGPPPPIGGGTFCGSHPADPSCQTALLVSSTLLALSVMGIVLGVAMAWLGRSRVRKLGLIILALGIVGVLFVYGYL